MAVGASTNDPVTEEPSGWTILVFLLWTAFGMAMFIPTLAVTSRRLHDANFSGAMLFLYLVPGVGSLVVAILCLFPSTPAGARFDPGFHPRMAAYPPDQGQAFLIWGCRWALRELRVTPSGFFALES